MIAPRHRRRQRGIALLLVLWAFMILGVLAFDFGRYMRDDAMAAVNFAEETQGYYVAVAAINEALLDEIRTANLAGVPDVSGGEGGEGDEDGEDGEDAAQGRFPSDGEWHAGTFHGATFEVRKTDECARIGINGLVTRAIEGDADDRERLRRIITNLLYGPNRTQGKSQREAQDIDGIVQAIIDWVDVDTATTGGAESDWYVANRGYEAKNGLFDAPQELLLVRGVTTELFYGVDGRPGLRDVVSVFCKSELLNARSITAEVLEVLFEVPPEEAAELVAQRATTDAAVFLPLLQARITAVDPTLAERLEWEPRATLVTVEARADTSRDRNRSTVAAIVDLSDELSDGPMPIRWFDRAPWRGTLPSGAGPEQAEPTP